MTNSISYQHTGKSEIEKTVACSPLPVPYLLQNKPQVQTHDFNQRQQPNTDTFANREDRGGGGGGGEQLTQKIEFLETSQAENLIEMSANQSNFLQQLTGDAELEKVFEHGDDIAGINQSSTDDGLRGQRTEKLSRQVNGQISTIF
ncbi:hypothetical protein FD724_39235 (plasmid) [Nostoc sp. C057]|uniref:hypothetical protein n=1 Tax=Nostoc sp. C057 TaxID=2576903 RepID=UPI0015C31557|nr:hypothetical protein [Nostoc sp. C057]QLE53860.1 hypothetical protein FD724_39235 [Nostoc sp. C057]